MSGALPPLSTCFYILHMDNTKFIILRIVSVPKVLGHFKKKIYIPNQFYLRFSSSKMAPSPTSMRQHSDSNDVFLFPARLCHFVICLISMQFLVDKLVSVIPMHVSAGFCYYLLFSLFILHSACF